MSMIELQEIYLFLLPGLLASSKIKGLMNWLIFLKHYLRFF